jgi:glycosyltransferase involved in cell wall biosynthesis
VILSVVIPVYNEEESITRTLDRVFDSASALDSKFEVIVVNDGSTDNTLSILESYKVSHHELRIINLSRNSGHMSALTAGIDHAVGRWVVTLDGDGQDPPELIPEMINLANENQADICFMVRGDRKQDALRHRIFSPVFYKTLSRATGGRAPLQAADFRLMSDRVVNVLRSLPETNRIYRVITPELGFKSVEMEYSRNIREAGQSKYKFVRLAILAFRSLIATTGAPLRWLSNISIVIAGASLCYSGYVFLTGLIGSGPPGWASVSLLLSLILFVQALAMAVICEFLLSILADVRKRPLYQLKDDRFGN